MLEKGDGLKVEFVVEDGIFIFDGFLEEFMTNFSLEGRDAEILLNILDYILKNKFFKVEGVLGFKISSPDRMRYLKIENKKLVDVTEEEYSNIIVTYVNKLMEIKNEGRELSNLYGFMKEDKKGNITFKILEKREGVTKTTQQATGSACSHFTVPKLKEMIKTVGSDSKGLKGKGNLCDRISFEMRKMESTDREKIYFYGLDDYLELK